MADGPKFAMYVRSVRGHVVQRYGTAELIGAARRPITKAQKNDGESAIEWNDRIVPLTATFCRKYDRELREHLNRKELIACTRENFEAERAAEAERIAESDAKAEALRAELEAQANKSTEGTGTAKAEE